MGCLLLLLVAASPRLGMVLYWIFRPGVVDAAFSTALLPVLGIVFLPLTTLVYTLCYTPGTWVAGAEWVLVGLAALFDIGHVLLGAGRRGDLPQQVRT